MIHVFSFNTQAAYNRFIEKYISKLNHSAVRYLVVGTGAFTADYVVLIIFYYSFKTPLWLATTLGYFTGFAISFTVNRRWVFGGQQRRMTLQIIEYAALVLFNYLFTVTALNFLNDHGVPPSMGKLAIMALIMCWNYTLFRWLIFLPTKD